MFTIEGTNNDCNKDEMSLMNNSISFERNLSFPPGCVSNWNKSPVLLDSGRSSPEDSYVPNLPILAYQCNPIGNNYAYPGPYFSSVGRNNALPYLSYCQRQSDSRHFSYYSNTGKSHPRISSPDTPTYLDISTCNYRTFGNNMTPRAHSVFHNGYMNIRPLPSILNSCETYHPRHVQSYRNNSRSILASHPENNASSKRKYNIKVTNSTGPLQTHLGTGNHPRLIDIPGSTSSRSGQESSTVDEQKRNTTPETVTEKTTKPDIVHFQEKSQLVVSLPGGMTLFSLPFKPSEVTPTQKKRGRGRPRKNQQKPEKTPVIQDKKPRNRRGRSHLQLFQDSPDLNSRLTNKSAPQKKKEQVLFNASTTELEPPTGSFSAKINETDSEIQFATFSIGTTEIGKHTNTPNPDNNSLIKHTRGPTMLTSQGKDKSHQQVSNESLERNEETGNDGLKICKDTKQLESHVTPRRNGPTDPAPDVFPENLLLVTKEVQGSANTGPPKKQKQKTADLCSNLKSHSKSKMKCIRKTRNENNETTNLTAQKSQRISSKLQPKKVSSTKTSNKIQTPITSMMTHADPKTNQPLTETLRDNTSGKTTVVNADLGSPKLLTKQHPQQALDMPSIFDFLDASEVPAMPVDISRTTSGYDNIQDHKDQTTSGTSASSKYDQPNVLKIPENETIPDLHAQLNLSDDSDVEIDVEYNTVGNDPEFSAKAGSPQTIQTKPITPVDNNIFTRINPSSSQVENTTENASREVSSRLKRAPITSVTEKLPSPSSTRDDYCETLLNQPSDKAEDSFAKCGLDKDACKSAQNVSSFNASLLTFETPLTHHSTTENKSAVDSSSNSFVSLWEEFSQCSKTCKFSTGITTNKDACLKKSCNVDHIAKNQCGECRTSAFAKVVPVSRPPAAEGQGGVDTKPGPGGSKTETVSGEESFSIVENSLQNHLDIDPKTGISSNPGNEKNHTSVPKFSKRIAHINKRTKTSFSNHLNKDVSNCKIDNNELRLRTKVAHSCSFFKDSAGRKYKIPAKVYKRLEKGESDHKKSLCKSRRLTNPIIRKLIKFTNTPACKTGINKTKTKLNADLNKVFLLGHNSSIRNISSSEKLKEVLLEIPGPMERRPRLQENGSKGLKKKSSTFSQNNNANLKNKTSRDHDKPTARGPQKKSTLSGSEDETISNDKSSSLHYTNSYIAARNCEQSSPKCISQFQHEVCFNDAEDREEEEADMDILNLHAERDNLIDMFS